MIATTERVLSWPDTLNTRELSGYETVDGRTVARQGLVRSGNLDRLTHTGQQALVGYGIRTIIDIRTPSEVQHFPNPFSGTAADAEQLRHRQPIYASIPLITDGHGAYERDAKVATSLLDHYQLILRHFPDQVAAIFRAITTATEGPILFFCHAGKDRTGIIAAVLLATLGVEPEHIDADYAESEQHIQPLLDEAITKVGSNLAKQERIREELSAKAGTMSTLLTSIDDEYGSVEAYLLQAGIVKHEIDVFRERLLL